VLRKLRLDRAVAEQPAVAAWAEVAGEAIVRHARARSIEDGVLVVVVDNAGWKTQLTWLKPQLLTRLNARLGRRIVRDIRLVSGGDRGPHQP
jgi:predicted nucleic acid-binding Zn ribbon protein